MGVNVLDPKRYSGAWLGFFMVVAGTALGEKLGLNKESLAFGAVVLKGVFEMLVSAAGGLVGSAAGGKVGDWERDPRNERKNHDLTRLVGSAIALVLHRIEKDKTLERGTQGWAASLAEVVPSRWVDVAELRPGFGAIASDQLPAIFAASTGVAAGDVRLLSLADCELLVRELHELSRQTQAMHPATADEIALVAGRLHRELFEAVREMFKRDFGAGGHAYAALSLDINAILLDTLRSVVETQGATLQAVQGALEQLREIRKQLDAEQVTLASQVYWSELRARYRSASVRKWLELFPRVHFGAQADEQRELIELVPWMGASTAGSPTGSDDAERPPTPFIATQGFTVLKPTNRPTHYLKSALFLPGRASEREARALQGSEWLALTRAEIVRALQRPGSALGKAGMSVGRATRLFFITGGGVGKTTNMRWLQAALNRAVEGDPDLAPLALRIDADKLSGESEFAGAVRKLAAEIARATGVSASEQQRALASIERGLERDIEMGRVVVLVDGLDHIAAANAAPFVLETLSERWDACAVVMAGRPHALAGWGDAPADAHAIDARRWRFIRPDEFSKEEARAYLDEPGTDSRYDRIEASLGGLAQVPRVLEYVRGLSDEQLASCRTSADIYWRAIEKLITRTIERSERMGGMKAHHALELLAALAFHGACPTVDGANRVAVTRIADVDEELKAALAVRTKALRHREDELDRDLERIGQFATLVGNGIVNAADVEDGPPKVLVWANPTVQDFLAAHWLARHADADDAARMRWHVFRPGETESDAFYELNVFLAEMPAEARTDAKWIAAVRHWYQADRSHCWASEMIFRSWPTMHVIADEPLDDWWNVSYQKLLARDSSALPAGRHSHTHAAQSQARALLDGYTGELQAMLDGERGPELQRAAEQLIDDDSWVAVPGGKLQMGSPVAEQGFPPETEAFWNGVLRDVQSGEKTAERAATECNPPHWFSGAAGTELRKEDIAWLTDVLAPLEHAPAGSVAGAAAYDAAFETIEHKWRRMDETPKENPQQVDAFFLQREPVLHRGYRLFAPAHERALGEFLARVLPSDDTVAVALRARSVQPEDDHPVIYVSWYDAWAFCQWARWTRGKWGYRLRLPHEVEWEHAARSSRGANGEAVQPREYQPYWWGRRYPSGSEDAKLAHLNGNPGATRAPGKAADNPLGLRDMLGNVWEWMANIYDLGERHTEQSQAKVQYSRHFPIGLAPANAQRTMRGGLWYYLDRLATVSNRYRLTPEQDDYKIGFRVVREQIKRQT